MSGSKKPLAGLRVIDFTAVIAGPYCTRLLADAGAEVIKVEAPGGDMLRQIAPMRNGVSSYFGQLNCGKKSIALNLKDPGDQQVAKDLIAGADVVVENNRPGVMTALGLAYPDVSAGRSDLVYCSISGFGQIGPDANRPAYAPMIHAASGFDLAQLGYQDELTRPEKCGVFIADVVTAVYAFGAIQTALVGLARHGTGQYIDVALLDTMVNLLVIECQEAQFPTGQDRPLYSPTRTSDGFVLLAPANQKNFAEMADAMGHPEWKDDPRFDTLETRRANWAAMIAGMESWTSERPAAECEAVMLAAGVPCSVYRTIAEVMDHPQSQARGLFTTATDSAGSFRLPNPPFQFADGSVAVSGAAPDLDEHGAALRQELAAKK